MRVSWRGAQWRVSPSASLTWRCAGDLFRGDLGDRRNLVSGRTWHDYGRVHEALDRAAEDRARTHARVALTMGYVKLGAGTYAFRDMDVFEALPGLRRIGFEAIEILAGEGWPTAHRRA